MKPEIISSYILDTFSNIYQLPNNIDISYGEQEDADIVIQEGNLSFFDYATALPEDFAWDIWNEKEIAFPLDTENKTEVITAKDDQQIINYDILAASFYFLSSWQEIHQTSTDNYGRFPYENSFQYKHNLILVPLVNYYFDILKTAIEQRTGQKVERKNSTAPFTAFLSHDIDQIHSGWKEDSKYEIKRGDVPAATSIITQRMRSNKDEWNNLDVIVELEIKLNVKSTFFFLAKKTEDDADYEIKDVEHYFDLIEQANSEIGVHGSLGAGFDGNKLKEEISTIGRNITGNRYHFLQNNAKITPQILDDANLKYDSSMCFDDHIGFRNSFCFPFRPFNFATQKAFNHLQIPLLIMDSTLKVEDYMGDIPYSYSKNMIDQIVAEVEYFGGVFTLLWHNTFFTNHKYKGWGPRYIQIVKELQNKNAEFMTGTEIAKAYGN